VAEKNEPVLMMKLANYDELYYYWSCISKRQDDSRTGVPISSDSCTNKDASENQLAIYSRFLETIRTDFRTQANSLSFVQHHY
jgi:hypothetical protein